MDEVPALFVALVQGETFTASGVLRTQGALAVLTLLPATFAMGGVFPLTIRLVSLGLERVGRDVGTAYAINTVGAIVGSFLGGFVVVPLLQLQPGIRLAAAINLALAALIVALSRWPRRWRHRPDRRRRRSGQPVAVTSPVGPLRPLSGTFSPFYRARSDG